MEGELSNFLWEIPPHKPRTTILPMIAPTIYLPKHKLIFLLLQHFFQPVIIIGSLFFIDSIGYS